LSFDLRLFPLALGLLVFPAAAQVSAPPAPTQAPAAAPAPAAIPPEAQPTPQKPAGPDYPLPRTFAIGAFYWFTGPGTNTGTFTGRASTDYETLADLGKPKYSPDLQIDIPITRTGQLRFEGFLTKGDGNQVIGTPAPSLFTTQFYTGDIVATQYQIKAAKLYLEDLLWPHKFPVAKFRVRSLWEVQYVNIKATIDAPAVTTGETGTGSHQIILPTFGLAPEYAISPHVLFRFAASGFGWYHKADIWDAEATISYRVNHVELVAGGKAFHFKTSPNDTEYFRGTLVGAIVGLRWHL
jgi:hypothetical protein